MYIYIYIYIYFKNTLTYRYVLCSFMIKKAFILYNKYLMLIMIKKLIDVWYIQLREPPFVSLGGCNIKYCHNKMSICVHLIHLLLSFMYKTCYFFSFFSLKVRSAYYTQELYPSFFKDHMPHQKAESNLYLLSKLMFYTVT